MRMSPRRSSGSGDEVASPRDRPSSGTSAGRPQESHGVFASRQGSGQERDKRYVEIFLFL